ncbi:MAG TPA: DnaJ domain-containing protein [Thermoanaerobaculia bacterium]|nr:DnaJ domain-containing protein [Thermoanaerobaculia bacterium]
MNGPQRVTPEELRLFTDRIARSLRERPLDVPPTPHKERVADFLRRAGEASHYELLGIELVASAREVHDGFERVARLLHPDNASRIGLPGREGVLEVLFERAVQAYLTLSHPDSRKAYDRELSPKTRAALISAISPSEDAARDLARRNYEKASALAMSEEYHFAIELMQQAVRSDPRGEYYALLGRLQAKNPQWLGEAASSLKRAMELGARDSDLPAALKEVKLRIESGDAQAPPDSMQEGTIEVVEEDEDEPGRPRRRASRKKR